jgi:hypothetical protein
MHRKLNVHIGVQKYIYISLFIATIQDIRVCTAWHIHFFFCTEDGGGGGGG